MIGAPPGPTPYVARARPGSTGVRVVVGSGQRVDVTWTVPADAATAPGGWFVGCHIPGHWQKGMVVPVRGRPGGTRWDAAALPSTSRGRLHPAAPSRRRPARAVPARARAAAFVDAPRSRATRPRTFRRASDMTYVIAEPCIDVLDESCVSVCPVDCIHFDDGTDRKLSIDPNECIDCGACEPECPVNAIFPEESLPAEWAPVQPDQRRLVQRQGGGARHHRRAQAAA